MIDGLLYYGNFISDNEQEELISIIDNSFWCEDLIRRTQHYGYKYNYKNKNANLYLGSLPEWSEKYIQHLRKNIEINFNQIIVNEYKKGQGIGQHIDCIECFDEFIASLTLNSSCIMDFVNVSSDDYEIGETKSILLEPKSILILCGDARKHWSHGIKKRQEKDRRISLTFRKVL